MNNEDNPTDERIELLLKKAEADERINDTELEEVASSVLGGGSKTLATELLDNEADDPEAVQKREPDIRTKLLSMKLPEKVKLAMFGNAVCRQLLIFDPNKMVQRFVLKNPKLTLKEVEDFAHSRNLSELILRSISDSKEWMRSYKLKHAIVTNPKTPQDVALKWMRYLNAPDIKNLARSKNVPQLIMNTARKILESTKGKK